MKYKILLSLILFIFILPQAALAAGLSLSVTPTIFEMSAVPLQAWNSSVKVINSNPQELTVYANVVNFAPQGETGQGKFLPVFEDFTEGKTLAEWITVSDESYTIPREGSVEIPLMINVPEDASPGGHFAAIMIGTVPLNSDNPFQVKTAQVVTSLFFVRVAGDVVENGTVRTFRTLDSFVDTPVVDFEVRFENKGNVHLQPQGEIVITNMWGKERGVVPINPQTHFGNVLPESVRKFDFTWKGEQSFSDIGRYKAILTLAYGTDQRQFSTQSVYFWVVPVKAVLSVLGGLLVIICFISWSIRAYVRKMLAVSVPQGYVPLSQRAVRSGDVLVQKKPSLRAPIVEGVDDLKSQLSRTHAFLDTSKMLICFIGTYKKFFGSLVATIVVITVISLFFVEVMTSQRDFEVTIDNPDASVTISSEEILYQREEEQAQQLPTPEPPAIDVNFVQTFELVLINSGSTPGAAAAMRKELEAKQYSVTSLQSDFEETKKRTVIVYDTEVQEEALVLSQLLEGALLSARVSDIKTNPPVISVFIGNDYHIE